MNFIRAEVKQKKKLISLICRISQTLLRSESFATFLLCISKFIFSSITGIILNQVIDKAVAPFLMIPFEWLASIGKFPGNLIHE